MQSEQVPYYCPSCDVSVRRAKKAKKQAKAKILKAKTSEQQNVPVAPREPVVVSSVSVRLNIS